MAIFEKNVKELSANANSAADNLDKLRSLILGHQNTTAQNAQTHGFDMEKQAVGKQLDNDYKNESFNRALKEQRSLPAGSHVSFDGAGISTPDPLTGLLRRDARDEKIDARNDKDLVHFGERIEKSGIPGNMSAFANLEQGTADPANARGGILSDPNYEVKSAGPVANALPQWTKNIGESVGLMPEGSAKEAALIQRLVNADIKALSGSAVSTYEMGRQNVEKGMSAGGDPNMIKLGIKQMQDAIASSAKNIESSSRPEVVNTYRQQGGKVGLEEYLGKPAAAPSAGLSPEKRARLEQLRAKHRNN